METNSGGAPLHFRMLEGTLGKRDGGGAPKTYIFGTEVWPLYFGLLWNLFAFDQLLIIFWTYWISMSDQFWNIFLGKTFLEAVLVVTRKVKDLKALKKDQHVKQHTVQIGSPVTTNMKNIVKDVKIKLWICLWWHMAAPEKLLWRRAQRLLLQLAPRSDLGPRYQFPCQTWWFNKLV